MSKSVKAQRMTLMTRDLDIFWSLHEARYLTIEAIEWLHFPQWRDRYQQWQIAQERGESKPYIPTTQAYTRLRLLQGNGYVRRIVRPAMLAVDTYRREPDLFFLTEKGATALAERRGVELAQVLYGEARQRSYLMLQHHVAVARVYAALRSRIDAKPGIGFTQWRSEHHAARDFDRITMRVPQPDGTHRTEETGIQPDGAFFIEYDGARSFSWKWSATSRSGSGKKRCMRTRRIAAVRRCRHGTARGSLFCSASRWTRTTSGGC